jgi:hypothetical protein
MTPLDRMLALVGKPIPYALGTGDAEGPTTRKDGLTGFDCAGAAISYAHGLKRHRPGFNRGKWATVSDDINTNSAIEDAEHARELFVPVDELDVRPGDLILYPTIYVKRPLQKPLPFIGHVQMVASAPRGWTREMGFVALDVVHCHGPDRRIPGVTRGDGLACDMHDERFAKNPTRIIRLR